MREAMCNDVIVCDDDLKMLTRNLVIIDICRGSIYLPEKSYHGGFISVSDILLILIF